MKKFSIWLGVLTILISITHGFFWDQSIVHSLLLHPVVLLFGLSMIAIGATETDTVRFCLFRKNKA